MALTLVKRESFQGVGTLNSGNPGNLGTVDAGSFFKRAIGPRITSDHTANSLGWSADFHILAGGAGDKQRQHTLDIASTSAVEEGIFTSWYFVSGLVANGSNRLDINRTNQSNGNQIVWIESFPGTNGNFWTNRGNDWTDRDSGVAIPTQQWFELRHSWHHVSGNNYDYTVAYRLAGSSTWVNILSGNYTFAGTIDNVQSGELGSGAAAYFQGRYGMPSLYSGTSYSSDTTALISDVADPVGPTTWYLNPATGNDNNDGVTPGSAWASVGKVNDESKYCGLFPSSSFLTGDTLVGDSSGGPLDLGGTQLLLITSGLNVKAAIGQTWFTIKAHKAISAGSWSGPISGTTKVYQASDSSASAVLWENDKWLNHPTGANLAAVQATLESTPGSFWTDGTTMYVHPFGDTNPGFDGKTYTRSYNFGSGASAIELDASNVNIQDIYCGKTCLADKATNDPIGAYVIGTGWAGGTEQIKHCYLFYGSKHGLGLVGNPTNDTVTIDNVQSEQCSPYGAQTPFVSFSDSNTGNNHVYKNCKCVAAVGVIGSAVGVAGQCLYAHNNSGSDQFMTLMVDTCDFGNNDIGGTNAVTSLIVTATKFGGDNLSGAKNKTITQCRWAATRFSNSALPNQNRADGTLIVRNCLFLPTIPLNDGSSLIKGAVTIEGNTFDLSNTSIQGGTSPGLLERNGALTLIFRDNLVIATTSQIVSLFKNFVNTDTLTIRNNAYVFDGSVIAAAYNDGASTADRSFAQWQALGFDANSMEVASVAVLDLDANYVPQTASPLVNAGVNIGPLTDYLGITIYAIRNTIGAIQNLIGPPNRLFIPTVSHTRSERNEAPVSPSDTVDLTPFAYFGLFIGGSGGGNLKVDMVGMGTVTFKGLTAGRFLPIQVRRVYSTGTDVTDIIARF